MSNAHVPHLREGHRGDATRGLDWVIISERISEDRAIRITNLYILGPPTINSPAGGLLAFKPLCRLEQSDCQTFTIFVASRRWSNQNQPTPSRPGRSSPTGAVGMN
jgi:hypothetical protein